MYFSACDCEGEGVASNVCDQETGNCQCQQGFTGPNCRQCAPGFYNYPFCARCACSAVGTTEDVSVTDYFPKKSFIL